MFAQPTKRSGFIDFTQLHKMATTGLKHRRGHREPTTDRAGNLDAYHDSATLQDWEEDPLRLRSPAPSSEPRDSPMHPSTNIRPTDTTLHLYDYNNAPSWARGNPFIHQGYRAHYTMAMCLRSIFTIHNETGNVWTHLLGMLFFLTCSVMFFSQVMKPMMVHFIVLIPFSFACVACMGLSAAYHLFSCHYCERVHDRMMQWDYFGITCLIVGSFLPPCYYAFQCEPMLRLLYLSMIGVLGSVGLVGPFFGFWAQERYYWLRLVVYCSVAGSGIFPVVHVNFVMPNGTATPYVFGLAIMMLLYFVGMMIYIFKIPERWFPGRFDIWLHSHQLWHVFVLCAAVVHFFNSGSMYLQLEPMEVHC